MAYLEFCEASAGADHGVAPRIAMPASRDAGLSALEWSVVALSAFDPLSTLREPGRIAMALGALFGDRTNPRLADPRLEALRRMSVLTWHHGHDVAKGELAAFLDAGFEPDQYDLLARTITAERARRRTRRARR